MKKESTIVITGASAGVGRATARAFARPGLRIGLLAAVATDFKRGGIGTILASMAFAGAVRERRTRK